MRNSSAHFALGDNVVGFTPTVHDFLEQSCTVAESLHRDALKAVVIPATARRAEHALAASSQIRMLASVKGLLTHANGIGYTPFNPGKGVALPALPESKRDKALSQSQSVKMLVTAQARAEATETEKRAKTRRRDYLLNKMLGSAVNVRLKG